MNDSIIIIFGSGVIDLFDCLILDCDDAPEGRWSLCDPLQRLPQYALWALWILYTHYKFKVVWKLHRGIGLMFAWMADGSWRWLSRHASDPVKPCHSPACEVPEDVFLNSLTWNGRLKEGHVLLGQKTFGLELLLHITEAQSCSVTLELWWGS